MIREKSRLQPTREGTIVHDFRDADLRIIKGYQIGWELEGGSGSQYGVRCIMKFDKAEEYRTEAQKCLGNAERTFDPKAKLSWKRLAEEWLEMASKLPASQFHISRVDSH